MRHQIGEKTAAFVTGGHLDGGDQSRAFSSRRARNESCYTSASRNNLAHGRNLAARCWLWTRTPSTSLPSPPGITCAQFHAVGLAGGVTIIKAGLQVEISQLYLTASATGLRGALPVITQEEEESPHLIKAVRGQRQSQGPLLSSGWFCAAECFV